MRRLKTPIRRAAGAAGDVALRCAGWLHRSHHVSVDYPPADYQQRYTRSRPHPVLHASLGRHEARYLQALQCIRGYDEALRALPLRAHDPREPSLVNDYLPGLDSAAIYAFIRDRRPARYVEVGSGNSTKLAARARADGSPATKITSIDPRPRTEIDAICDLVVRRPLERVPAEIFSELRAGDIVFFDGSHSVFMGNDVAVFMLEVLPCLAPGVLVGIHDIYLPFDYPRQYADRHYTEQYVLAAYLLAEPAVEIVLPAQYVMTVPALRSVVNAMWNRPDLHEIAHHGVAFWLQT